MTIITDYEALVAFLTLFFCWIFQEILERPLGLRPKLHTVSSIENIARLTSKASVSNLNSPRMINENEIDDYTPKTLEDLLALEAYHDASAASTSRTPPHIASPMGRGTGNDNNNNNNSNNNNHTTDSIKIHGGTGRSPSLSPLRLTFRATTIMKRLTHSVDEAGIFRMQVRSSTHFIKGVWNIIMLFFSGFVAFDSSFYYDHFIKFDKTSVDYLPYRCISASILVFYAWEMILEKSRIKFQWSLAVHHWLTSLFALAILQGFYLPSATWYGFTSVQLVFPLWFTLGFRAVFSMKSKKYAKITRIMAKFCYYWYIIVTLSNASGQFYIYISRIIYGKLNVFEGIMLPVAVMAWMYDDYTLLRAIHGFSEQEYELATNINVTTIRSIKPPPMRIPTRSIDVTAIDVNGNTDVNNNNNKNNYTNKHKNKNENEKAGAVAVVTSTSPGPGTPLIAAAVRAVEAVGQGSIKLQSSTVKKEMEMPELDVDNDGRTDKKGDNDDDDDDDDNLNDDAYEQQQAQQERNNNNNNNNGRESAVVMYSDNDTEYKENDALQAGEINDGRTMSIKVEAMSTKNDHEMQAGQAKSNKKKKGNETSM